MPQILAWFVLLFAPSLVFAQGTQADYNRAAKLPGQFRRAVKSDRVEPNWAADGNSFWYRAATTGKPNELVQIDAVKGTRTVVPIAPPPVPKPDVAARPERPRRSTSPDGKWTLRVQNHNLILRDNTDKTETPLTTNGTAEDAYSLPAFWSPDSTHLVVHRRTAGTDRVVTLVESRPADQVQPKTQTYRYAKPGDPIPQPKPHLFRVATKAEVPLSDELFANPWDISYEHWTPDSKRFFFVYNQRGHGVVRVNAIDAETGKITVIANETPNTFFDYANKLFLQHLDTTDELIWMSEHSGWNHLYRVNRSTGKTTAITSGNWVVRGVESVDVDARTIVIRAMGREGQDPYHVHYARVKMDGGEPMWLTDADGTHEVQFSPDRRFYLDRYSRVDALPVTELRDAATGARVLTLEVADDAPLRARGWRPPARFVAPGRDGRTPIYGNIYRPSTFDAAKSYRVIESIYAGPHGQHVPKAFRAWHGPQALAELGFVVVQIDGMGTNWRSKAFHDVCWKNLGDAGFPDRIAWLKALEIAYANLNVAAGVGIYGGSAGGQNALGGMLAHPAIYTVGVADCGCHDNRMDKVWWNELWMGWPVGPHYAEQSNVTNAHKLRGKLMLIVGELDRNVDPASTLQVADALIKADKDFELLLLPGVGHGAAETPYASRRRADFFVRNLLQVEPRR